MTFGKTVETALALIETDPSKVLQLSFGSGDPLQPGAFIPRQDAQTVPTIAASLPDGSYLVVNLDLDAPFPSLNLMSPILHWMQSDIQPRVAGETTLVASQTDAIASWSPPRPPPGSGPHRYLSILFRQPEEFDRHSWNLESLRNRPRFDMDSFVDKANLGQVIAANYFCSK